MNSRHLLGRRGLYLTFLLAVAALLVTAGPAAARLRYSAQTYAYITNSSGNSVSVIDTSDVRRNYNPVVQTTLPLGVYAGRPVGIAVPPVNRYNRYETHRAYTANASGWSMSVIESTPGPDPRYDPWSHRVIATVPVPGCYYPMGIAAHPDGTRVFLACTGSTDASVVVVSTADPYPVLANIPLYNQFKPSFPYGIHVTPGGKKVYVTDQAQNKLIVINANNYNIKKRKDLPTGQAGNKLGPEGVHVDPRGRTVWVAYSLARPGDIGVSVYNVSDESLVGHVRFPDDAQPASVYARSRRQGWVTLYKTAELAEVRAYSSSPGRIVRRTPVGGAPQGLTADRYRNVYVANFGGNSVTTVFRRRRVLPLTLGVGRSPYGFGEFIAPRECRRCQ